jgi:hypothetical protein
MPLLRTLVVGISFTPIVRQVVLLLQFGHQLTLLDGGVVPTRAILGDGTDARSASAERSESPTGATKAFAFTRFGIATAPTTNQIDLISSCRFIAEHFQITQ